MLKLIKKIILNPLNDNYQDADDIVRQRVKALHILCLFSFLLISIITVHTRYVLDQKALWMVLPLVFSDFGIFIVLFILNKGLYDLAISTFLVIATSLVWVTIFIEVPYNQSNPIFITDTIVFLYSLLVFAVLLSGSRKVFVPIYYCSNVGVIISFAFYVDMKCIVPHNFVNEYVMDNFFAFTIIFVVTNSIRTINEKSLQKVKIEVAKNKELNETLEKRVIERTEALKKAQDRLVENAHQAGQADVAISVLHNVGNVLNSVVASSEIIISSAKKSEIHKISKANTLLKNNLNNLENFIVHNPKGKKLIEYYLRLEDLLTKEKSILVYEANRLADKVEIIKNIVLSQQSYASGTSLSGKVKLEDIVEDALNIELDTLSLNNISIHKTYEETPLVNVQRVKLIHVIINLLQNAKDAMLNNDINNRQVIINLFKENENVKLVVADNGCGIAEQNLIKIFTHGYTTKQGGHGFGLHSCANYLNEMNGKMWAENNKKQDGATFVLLLPIANT